MRSLKGVISDISYFSKHYCDSRGRGYPAKDSQLSFKGLMLRIEDYKDAAANPKSSQRRLDRKWLAVESGMYHITWTAMYNVKVNNVLVRCNRDHFKSNYDDRV